MSSTDELTELKTLCPGASQAEEGKVVFFLLPSLTLPDGCIPKVVDALLCPSARDGYPSRLFLSERITSRQNLNWNATNVRILDRNWHAYSWMLKHSKLRLVQLV